MEPNIEYIIPNPNDRIIFINICETFKSGERGSVYECTRKFWKLDGKRAQKATHVLAFVDGVVVGVFKPKIWYITEDTFYKRTGRWEFEGEEILDSPYIGKNILNVWKTSQNPIQYYNM